MCTVVVACHCHYHCHLHCSLCCGIFMSQCLLFCAAAFCATAFAFVLWHLLFVLWCLPFVLWHWFFMLRHLLFVPHGFSLCCSISSIIVLQHCCALSCNIVCWVTTLHVKLQHFASCHGIVHLAMALHIILGHCTSFQVVVQHSGVLRNTKHVGYHTPLLPGWFYFLFLQQGDRHHCKKTTIKQASSGSCGSQFLEAGGSQCLEGGASEWHFM